MGLVAAMMLAFLPLAPVALLGEIIPGADDAIYQALAYVLTPLILLFG